MMRKLRSFIVMAAAPAVLAGCNVFQGVVGDSLGIPVESKRVAQKQGSNELIAWDATYCLVTEGRFSDVEIGDLVLCAWSSRDPRDLAAPN